MGLAGRGYNSMVEHVTYNQEVACSIPPFCQVKPQKWGLDMTFVVVRTMNPKMYLFFLTDCLSVLIETVSKPKLIA